MNRIKMIVGLSNPKLKYHNTRHNVGSWYIYSLVKKCNIILKEEKKFFGFTSYLNVESHAIRFLIPNIFMNINGQAVFKMASFYNIHLNEILIVHDDLELQPGISKLKYSYGHNGHNGLRNIINVFNNKMNFYRYRIGIGRPIERDKISSLYYLSLKKKEELLIKKSILYAIEETFRLNILKF